MQIELVNLDKAITSEKLKLLFLAAAKKLVDRLCLHPSLLNTFPDLKSSVELCSLIDFPDGLSSQTARLSDLLYSLKCGAKYIDLTLNNVLIQNVDFVKLKHEIKSFLDAAKIKPCTIRCVLEYRLFDSDLLVHLAEELLNVGINELVTSTGRMSDEFSDNLLIAKEIQDKVGLGVTIGGITSVEQYKLASKAGLKGVRFYSLSSFEKVINA